MDGGLLDLLSDDNRRALLSKMVRRSFRKGDTLFHEGDPGDTIHVIEKGHVAIRTSTPGGDVATLAVLGPGSSFGEQALLTKDAIRTASAVALDQVETRSLQRGDFEQLRASTPAVERFLVEALAAQVRRLSAQLLDALYVSADQRVVRRLAEVAELYSTSGSHVEVPLKQDDLASMAGTARPTANRVLKQLETAGIIRLFRGQMVVVDLTGLRKRAR
jgi:CRP/FNR family transcriptional regulator, cyclic AMP receptor protein